MVPFLPLQRGFQFMAFKYFFKRQKWHIGVFFICGAKQFHVCSRPFYVPNCFVYCFWFWSRPFWNGPLRTTYRPYPVNTLEHSRTAIDTQFTQFTFVHKVTNRIRLDRSFDAQFPMWRWRMPRLVIFHFISSFLTHLNKDRLTMASIAKTSLCHGF